MIPVDMPEAFAAVIRQHGGEWLEWRREPSPWYSGFERWAAEADGVEYALILMRILDATAPGSLCTVFQVERNSGSRASVTKVVPPEYSQTLENWFYQARLAAHRNCRNVAVPPWTPAKVAVAPEEAAKAGLLVEERRPQEFLCKAVAKALDGMAERISREFAERTMDSMFAANPSMQTYLVGDMEGAE